MHDDLNIKQGLTIPADELSFAVSRSGGPGGQHANKTSTRVTLYWNVQESRALDDTQRTRLLERLSSRLSTDGVLQVDASETRSQFQNRVAARRRLAEIVREALVVRKRRVATRPSRASEKRRLEAKKARSRLKAQRRYKPSRDD